MAEQSRVELFRREARASGHWLESGQQPSGCGGAALPSPHRTSAQTIFWQKSFPVLETAPKFIKIRHSTRKLNGTDL